MRAVVVVVAKVVIQQTPQMALVENDHVVWQISSQSADQALADAVLPRAVITGLLRSDAHVGREILHGSKDGVVVEQKVFWDLIVGEGFTELLLDPGGRGMPRGVDVREHSPSMLHDDEDVQLPEVPGRNDQEVHGSKHLAVVL